MNTTPKKHGREVWEPGCGHKMMETTAMAFWQSRMTVSGHVADTVHLADLRALARDVRTCFAEEAANA